jgi:hypothetical protein
MAERDPDGERQYLLAVAARLNELLAEAGRVNRRLRNARTAVHSLESELARLCEDVLALAAEPEGPDPTGSSATSA